MAPLDGRSAAWFRLWQRTRPLKDTGRPAGDDRDQILKIHGRLAGIAHALLLTPVLKHTLSTNNFATDAET